MTANATRQARELQRRIRKHRPGADRRERQATIRLTDASNAKRSSAGGDRGCRCGARPRSTRGRQEAGEAMVPACFEDRARIALRAISLEARMQPRAGSDSPPAAPLRRRCVSRHCARFRADTLQSHSIVARIGTVPGGAYPQRRCSASSARGQRRRRRRNLRTSGAGSSRSATRRSRRRKASPDRSATRSIRRASRPARADRQRGQPRMVEAPEPHADDEQHRAGAARARFEHVEPCRPAARARRPRPRRRRVGARGEAPVGVARCGRGRSPRRAGARPDAAPRRRAKRVRIAVASGAVTLPAASSATTSSLTPRRLRHARADRLHADGAHAGGDEPAQQRDGDDRLADAGVGAGDEDAACRGGITRGRRSSRTIGSPSAVRFGSPFHAWP